MLVSILKQRPTVVFNILKTAAHNYDKHKRDLQVRPHPDQEDLLKRFQTQPEINTAPLELIQAPPGCGKTMIFMLLAYGRVMEALEQKLPVITHISAPTKQLVSEIEALVLDLFPGIKKHVAPLGNNPAGNSRWDAHMDMLIKENFPVDIAELAVLEAVAQRDFEAFGHFTGNDAVWETMKEKFRAHFIRAQDFWLSARLKDFVQEVIKGIKCVVTTTTYKLKTESGSKTELSIIMKDKQLQLHIIDEVDMIPVRVFVAACAKDPMVLAAFDPAQRLAPVKEHIQDRSMDEMAKIEDTASWLEKSATRLELRETSRFGPRVVDLLKDCFPEIYKDLTARPDAPDTEVHAFIFQDVKWEQHKVAPGAVFHWKVFTVLAGKVRECVSNREKLIILCMYAAQRELVADLLRKIGIPVVTKRNESADDNTVQCMTSRQFRGSARDVVICLFFRRYATDPTFLAHANDEGQIAVNISRARQKLMLMLEELPAAAGSAWGQPRNESKKGAMEKLLKHAKALGGDQNAKTSCRIFDSGRWWAGEDGVDWDTACQAYEFHIEDHEFDLNAFGPEDEGPVSLKSYFACTHHLSCLQDNTWHTPRVFKQEDIPDYTRPAEVDSRVWKKAAWQCLYAATIEGYTRASKKNVISEEDYQGESDEGLVDDAVPEPDDLRAPRDLVI